jgi:transposase-like protein
MNRNRPDVPARPGNVHRLRKLSGAAAEASGREYPYSDQERAEVLALAEQVGDQAAGEETGVNPDLISQWRRKAARDLKAARAAYLAGGGVVSSPEAQAPDWRTQRELEANRAGLDAIIVRDRATQAMLDGNWQLVRAGAAYYIALTDRAQLLTPGQGRTTAEAIRNMTPEQRRREEQTLIEAWKWRAEEAGNTVAAEALDARLAQLRGEQPEAAS